MQKKQPIISVDRKDRIPYKRKRSGNKPVQKGKKIIQVKKGDKSLISLAICLLKLNYTDLRRSREGK